MKTPLSVEALLADLDRESRRALAACDARYEAAVSKIPVKFESLDDFEQAIGQFALEIQHGDVSALGLDEATVEYWGKERTAVALKALNDRWQGIHQMFADVRNDVNGGLRGIFAAVFDASKAAAVSATRHAKIASFVVSYNQLDQEMQMQVADDYWMRFGQYFSKETVLRYRELRAMSLHDILLKHSSVMAPLTDSIRGFEERCADKSEKVA